MVSTQASCGRPSAHRHPGLPHFTARVQNEPCTNGPTSASCFSRAVLRVSNVFTEAFRIVSPSHGFLNQARWSAPAPRRPHLRNWRETMAEGPPFGKWPGWRAALQSLRQDASHVSLSLEVAPLARYASQECLHEEKKTRRGILFSSSRAHVQREEPGFRRPCVAPVTMRPQAWPAARIWTEADARHAYHPCR